MNRTITTLAAACFALSASIAVAQAPSGERPRMSPEQREKMRDHMKAAREACKDNPDRRGCMLTQFCSKSTEPAKCINEGKARQAKMGQRMDERQKAHEACTGKRGEELGKCLREQPGMKGRHHDRMKG